MNADPVIPFGKHKGENAMSKPSTARYVARLERENARLRKELEAAKMVQVREECPGCGGMGRIRFSTTCGTIACNLCHGTGWVGDEMIADNHFSPVPKPTGHYGTDEIFPSRSLWAPHMHGCSAMGGEGHDPTPRVESFHAGLQWTWAYYSGRIQLWCSKPPPLPPPLLEFRCLP